ncbi:MAG: ComEC/Rec2 family competence protein [Deltaproteobacteria bacterium]|jgi:competence protein ComEC|nr:ComEC/Rec2 family competence protein [Deltaproteobacteria bacterium]
MPDKVYSRPIVALLFALIGGILFGSHFAGHVVGAAIISCMSAIWAGYQIWRRQAGRWTPIILFAALGYVSIQPWVSPRLSADHIHSFSDETRWQVTGVVDSDPHDFAHLKRFVLQADTLKYKDAAYRVKGKIRVTVRGRGPQIARGDRVEFRSRLRRPRNFNNPGGFNYQRYMDFRNIRRTAYTRGDRIRVIQKHGTTDLSDRLSQARRAMAALIESAGQGPSTAVLKALVIGDRAALTSELRDQFNRAGVGHVLAISGLHIGIVAAVSFFLFQRLLRLVRPLLWKAWTRKGAAILSLVPVCFYGLISGMSPSTQRAVIMVCAFLLTFVVERERDALNILALAAFIILIVSPPSFFSISFQLSFMAVLSILYGMSCWQTRSVDKDPAQAGLAFQVRRKLKAFFLVSVFAICGTLPLVMTYFNQISLIGLVANFMIVPLVGFGVIPCGLLALFVYPISSQLAFVGVKICTRVLDMAMVVIIRLADFPFAALKTFTPSLLEILCYYLLGWALLQRLSSQTTVSEADSPPQRPSDARLFAGGDRHAFGKAVLNRILFWLTVAGRWVSAKLAGKQSAIVGLGAILVLVADAGYWVNQRYWRSDLRVTYLDVGQGNAALLELPDGVTALIDGGGFSDNTSFDMGARVIAPYLLRQKIRTVDTLILTHPNSDHLNGLIYIAEHFNVKSIWTNGETRATSGYQAFRDTVDRKGYFQPDFQQLDRRQQINGVEIIVLYPPADFMTLKISERWRTTNNNSLVVKVSFGNVSFLFPGDIMIEAEKELVNLAGTELGCDVLLAPHHGSRSSSSHLFLNRVQPDITVISAGWKNRFRFPHPAVLAAYQEQGCRIFRTDINGAIIITTDGNHLTVKPFISSDDPP